MLVEVIEFKEWMLWKLWGFRNGCWWMLWGLRNRCGYIGRYMNVIDKGFHFYLIKTYHDCFQLMKINYPPPNLLLAGFPTAKASLLFVLRKSSPYYYFLSFSTYKRLTSQTQIAIKQNTGCNLCSTTPAIQHQGTFLFLFHI